MSRANSLSIVATLAGLLPACAVDPADRTANDQAASQAELDPADPAAARAAAGKPRSLREVFAESSTTRAIATSDLGILFVQCAFPYSFYAQANGRWVSTELGYATFRNAMLRASATEIGRWEQYELCFDGSDGTWFLRAANDLFVSTELGFPGSAAGMLRASATAPDRWERFYITQEGWDGPITIASVANGLFVSTELGFSGADTGMLRASATVAMRWEIFELH